MRNTPTYLGLEYLKKKMSAKPGPRRFCTKHGLGEKMHRSCPCGTRWYDNVLIFWPFRNWRSPTVFIENTKTWIKMFRNTFQSGFLSILYSIGSKPLQIWDKKGTCLLSLSLSPPSALPRHHAPCRGAARPPPAPRPCCGFCGFLCILTGGGGAAPPRAADMF